MSPPATSLAVRSVPPPPSMSPVIARLPHDFKGRFKGRVVALVEHVPVGDDDVVRRQQIDVVVAVDVGRVERRRVSGVLIDGVVCPRAVFPQEPVDRPDVGVAARDVESAVAVDVQRDDVDRVVVRIARLHGRELDDLIGVVRVVVADGLVVGEGDEHVEGLVVAHVREDRADGPRVGAGVVVVAGAGRARGGRATAHGAGGGVAAVEDQPDVRQSARGVVVVEHDLLGAVERRDDVDVAVAVDVDREDGAGGSPRVRDDALDEGLGAVVLEPRDRAVAGGRRQRVDVAVAVDVAPRDVSGRPFGAAAAVDVARDRSPPT
mmetsp:Transcript_18395/g.60145  ORF Transcript_18395/g.60145 Transcript_18395/m.60145 type:complete len:320 (+) Transcript_18395:531-1490(+)